MIHRSILVGQPAGVHARIAAQAVLVASRFTSSLFVRTGSGTASLTRLADLLALDIGYGDRIEILADGPDEQDALAAVCILLARSDHHGRRET